MDPKEIITKLRVRPNIKILNLNHSALGGEGSKVLFRWLAYGDDGVYEENNDRLLPPLPQLINIDLTGACLGDVGFSALVGWLECLKKKHQTNMSISPSSTHDDIRGLLLQNVRLSFFFFLDLFGFTATQFQNHIVGTSELALSFISALSFHKTEPPYIFSSLSYLNLSSNPLSTEFKQALFSSLASLPSLRKLLLSMTGLDPTHADAIAAYISQCRLTEFNASANNIGYKGLKKILKAIRRCWTLERVNLYANDGDMGDDDEESSDDEEESPRHPDLGDQRGLRLVRFDRRLGRVLSHNSYWKRIVRDQALELLTCSRLLLLNRHSTHDWSELDLLVELVAKETPHHSICTIHQHNCECLPTFHNPQSKKSSLIPIHASNSHFPFTRLPTELQLVVLSQLAPILSSSQQTRIFEYAIDKTTLPDLSLRLPSFGDGSSGGTSLIDITERQRWLELVGCDAYDPN